MINFLNKAVLPDFGFHDNVIQYFQSYHLTAYICLHPFVRIPQETAVREYAASFEIQKRFFFYVKDSQHHVPWRVVAEELGFPSLAYLHEVLLVGDHILARSRRFDYEQLRQDALKLYGFLKENNIVQLSEGSFPVQHQIAFLKSFLHLGYKQLVGVDAFMTEEEEFDVAEKIHFLETERGYYDYRSIYSKDLKAAVMVEWDGFYSVFAATQELLPQIVASHPYDGFYPDAETTFLL